MQEYNLHTHSVYCGHGEGTLDDYADYALLDGLKTLGFSEHLPFPDNRLSFSRMDYSMKAPFEVDLERVRRKYSEKGLEILKGWECDYFDDMDSYYEELRETSDYLIVGVHNIPLDGKPMSIFGHYLRPDDLYAYADIAIKAISTGYFTYMAHPDVFFYRYQHFDADAKAVSNAIIDAALEMNLPLEANGNGIIRESLYRRPAYPMREFWDLAISKGVKVVAATDAHKPENVAKPLIKLESFFSCYKDFRFLTLDEVLRREPQK